MQRLTGSVKFPLTLSISLRHIPRRLGEAELCMGSVADPHFAMQPWSPHRVVWVYARVIYGPSNHQFSWRITNGSNDSQRTIQPRQNLFDHRALPRIRGDAPDPSVLRAEGAAGAGPEGLDAAVQLSRQGAAAAHPAWQEGRVFARRDQGNARSLQSPDGQLTQLRVASTKIRERLEALCASSASSSKRRSPTWRRPSCWSTACSRSAKPATCRSVPPTLDEYGDAVSTLRGGVPTSGGSGVRSRRAETVMVR